jgi:hypothetical protein
MADTRRGIVEMCVVSVCWKQIFQASWRAFRSWSGSRGIEKSELVVGAATVEGTRRTRAIEAGCVCERVWMLPRKKVAWRRCESKQAKKELEEFVGGILRNSKVSRRWQQQRRRRRQQHRAIDWSWGQKLTPGAVKQPSEKLLHFAFDLRCYGKSHVTEYANGGGDEGKRWQLRGRRWERR